MMSRLFSKLPLVTLLGVGTGCPTPPTGPTKPAEPTSVSIQVAPLMATLSLGEHLSFGATVTGPDSTVTWTIKEANGGQIGTNGAYTAPPMVGTYHVVVTSHADATKAAKATVTVTDGTITGVKAIRHLYKGAETAVPVDLSKAAIQALQPSTTASTGYNTYPGMGTAAGTFSIPSVPPGPYLLTVDGVTFLRLSTRTVDLSEYDLGRANVKAADAGTTLNLAVTAMTPWSEFLDDLQVTSEGAGLGYGSLYLGDSNFSPDGGVTSVAYALDYSALATFFGGGGLIDASQGDVTYVTHLAAQPMTPAMWSAVSIKEAFSSTAYSLVNGGNATLGGAFSPVTQSTFSATFPRSQYSALLGAVNPTAKESGGHIYLDAQPGGAAYGNFGATPDLLSVDFLPGNIDEAVSMGYRNPFPSAWPLFGDAEDIYRVQYTVTSGTISGTKWVYAYNWTGDTLAGALSAGLGPRITPSTELKINGNTAYTSPQSGVGTKPILSWKAPTTGTPTGYQVLVYELKYADTGVTRTTIYSVFGDAGFTSLTLPGGLLRVGGSYVALIRARAEPGTDFKTRPLGTSFPSSGADTLTGLFSP